MDDLYEVLQIHPHARPEVARAAYRALARLHHPDLGGDSRHMTALNNAWAVIGDADLRANYDAKRAPRAASIDVATDADGQGDLVSCTRDAPARSRHDQSTALDFGRYAGWTLAQLVDADPNYLEWVIRTAIGRRLTGEVEELLGHRAAAAGSGVGAVGTPIASRRAR